MRIIFMGTPEFAVPSLRALAEAGYLPIAVVTAPDRPRGRGRRVAPSAVKEAATDLGIPTILQPESVRDPDFAVAVRDLNADLQVIVAFRILPPEVFTAARLGSFNLHGSLLPKYRGAAPIHRAVMAGDTETGVTTFFLKEKVDTGNMILQRSMPVGPEETTGDVHDRMMILGAEAVVETVRLVEAGKAASIRQNDGEATPAPKVFREEAGIDWTLSATEVHNHVRGLSPVPGAWTHFRQHLLKVYRTRPLAGEGDPGVVLSAEERLVVACGTGALEITELQQAGRRRLSSADFTHGVDLQVGERLETLRDE